ncbi:MAG: FtsQ-type POTRA domain-containing protein [bacterium]|nr:FtsQ-type POTRA domain-containing protein [bacterium]
MRKKNKKNRKKTTVKFLKAFGWLVFAATVTFGLAKGVRYWYSNSDIFYVSGVEINGATILTINEIESMIEIEPEQRINDIEVDPLKENILKNPFIENVSIGRKYPSTIKVDVVERKPVAFIALDKVYLIDDQGYILPKSVKTSGYPDYPIITGIKIGTVKTGEKTENNEVFKVLEFLESLQVNLPQMVNEVSELHYNPDGGISVFLSKTGLRIDCGSDDFALKFARMEFFLDFLENDNSGEKLSYINLNYKDMIVVKE